ncbi:hypothetical protein SAMN05421762_2379 [Pseudooceanicola nitratireducens]|uniref:Uncharacterized protein n=1 Tax=Pseudooceanicola nitratireducens TaxID=517719 RepID=A0A1I1ME22_9RHOB|nr:hypothetical protein [Pseudooceanicola nitratireducens]SEI87519.1 hypothetical protein SAMN05216183_101961 [Pseudooceanicola nitratireducens]SFC83711.1 hypothetical protein SAMN05421762_2379 [Pseudooceanicola nitratireducens]
MNPTDAFDVAAWLSVRFPDITAIEFFSNGRALAGLVWIHPLEATDEAIAAVHQVVLALGYVVEPAAEYQDEIRATAVGMCAHRRAVGISRIDDALDVYSPGSAP